MKLTYLFKSGDCAGENCPAVYDTDSGDLFVQGYNPTGDETAQLHNIGADEGAVRIPYALAEQIADMVNARRA